MRSSRRTCVDVLVSSPCRRLARVLKQYFASPSVFEETKLSKGAPCGVDLRSSHGHNPSGVLTGKDGAAVDRTR